MKPLLEAIRPTTIVKSAKLNDFLGLDLTIASETFQHTGSFKFRAGYNVALNVPNDELLTASSGNFGQALAYACKLLGKKCTVIMPETSAQVKIEAVRRFGATVDLIDVRQVARTERIRQLKEQMPDAYVASPYDDRFVIDGNSTFGDELSTEAFDSVVAPVGGGGLISGISLAFARNRLNTQILGAEPLLGNDASRSLKSGNLVANDTEPMTIADGARTLSVGKLNWEIIRQNVSEIVEVPDEKTAEALRLYYELANLKVEPTGALALGAVLTEKEKFADRKVCVVVSGGNVDSEVYTDLLMQKPAR